MARLTVKALPPDLPRAERLECILARDGASACGAGGRSGPATASSRSSTSSRA